MGVEYDPVSGVGIKVTDDFVSKMISAGVFSLDDWEDDKDYALSKTGLSYCWAGNAYSGDTYFYLFVDGNNLTTINLGAEQFILQLKDMGISVTASDLMIVNDMLISWQAKIE